VVARARAEADARVVDLPAGGLLAAEPEEPEADGLAEADPDPPDPVTVGVGAPL
jgi:hypothetical protein